MTKIVQNEDIWVASQALHDIERFLESIDTALAEEFSDCKVGIGGLMLDKEPNYREIPTLLKDFIERHPNVLDEQMCRRVQEFVGLVHQFLRMGDQQIRQYQTNIQKTKALTVENAAYEIWPQSDLEIIFSIEILELNGVYFRRITFSEYFERQKTLTLFARRIMYEGNKQIFERLLKILEREHQEFDLVQSHSEIMKIADDLRILYSSEKAKPFVDFAECFECYHKTVMYDRLQYKSK